MATKYEHTTWTELRLPTTLRPSSFPVAISYLSYFASGTFSHVETCSTYEPRWIYRQDRRGTLNLRCPDERTCVLDRARWFITARSACGKLRASGHGLTRVNQDKEGTR